MTPVEPNTASGILGELAERLGHFHESARALVDCLQTRNVRRKTDQCVIETAKCMFHKLLGEASDDLDRVTLQSRADLRVETTRNIRRSRTETASEKPYSRPEALAEESCPRPETVSENFCSRFETTSPFRGPMEQVAVNDFRKQLDSVPLYRCGKWKYELKMSS